MFYSTIACRIKGPFFANFVYFPVINNNFAELANKSWPVICRKIYLITLNYFLLSREQREMRFVPQSRVAEKVH